jgi:hypothetical protein
MQVAQVVMEQPALQANNTGAGAAVAQVVLMALAALVVLDMERLPVPVVVAGEMVVVLLALPVLLLRGVMAAIISKVLVVAPAVAWQDRREL